MSVIALSANKTSRPLAGMHSGVFKALGLSFILLGFPFPRAGAQGIHTIQRTLHTHDAGDVTYVCLAIDGGVVPLVPSSRDMRIQAGGGISITWTKDNSIATFRGASAAEATLADLMGTPKAADAWKSAIASTLHGSGYTVEIHPYQPDILDVNHWRIGAITMDYAIGGRKSSSLLMIWRCKDGSTLAITMNSDPAQFKGHCDELYGLVGSSMLMRP